MPDSMKRVETLLLTCHCTSPTPIPHTPTQAKAKGPANLHLERCTEHSETLHQEESHHKKDTRHSAIVGNFFQ